jgi:hypothetical protein
MSAIAPLDDVHVDGAPLDAGEARDTLTPNRRRASERAAFRGYHDSAHA